MFARIALFVRQVIAELKKVVWLTRSDLITYTIVVLVFVAVVMAFVTVVDLGIGQLTRWAFGG
nr:preprotein translocase subunit SecE [Cellulomonas sp. RIT-PI-Y]